MLLMKKNGDIFDSNKVDENKFRKSSFRILTKKKSSVDSTSLVGRVVAIRGRNYSVEAEIVNPLPGKPKIINPDCNLQGTIKTNHEDATLVSVGDYVHFNYSEKMKKGRISSVEDRTTWLSRKSIYGGKQDVIASNSEFVVIIVSCAYPEYNKRLIDRLIVAAKIGNLVPVLCINKSDFKTKEIELDLSIYEMLGYKICYTNALTGDGVDFLVDFLMNKDSIFIGSSGVGKSSLLNNIFGKPIQKVLPVSERTTKGKHTTSHAEIFRLGGSDSKTLITDTPGIREFGIVNIKREELTLYFDEFNKFYEQCRFMPCTHTHEPSCAIKDALEKGLIDWERYESYINIFETL